MNRTALSFLAILIIAPLSISFGNSDDFIASGDSLYSIFDYENSINEYSNAIASDSLSFEAYWKLARNLNEYAVLQPENEQLELFEKASKLAQKTIALDSLLPEGHFEYARAIGKIALFKGILSSVGLAKIVKKEAEITLLLNPAHDGAYHMLGRWHREVSGTSKIVRVPLGLGEADRDKGLPLLSKAIELSPALIHHRYEYGLSLIDSGFKNEADKQFEICSELQAIGPLETKYKKLAKEAKEYLAKKD
jgi:tetratricopeptide (TPR) repeat protein